MCFYELEEENEQEKFYLMVFEFWFFKNSEEFYVKECENFLRVVNISRWLRYIFDCLIQEVDWCGMIIEVEMFLKVLLVIDCELICKYLYEFLGMEGSGLRFMIDNDKVEDFFMFYKFILRIDDNKEVLCEIF